MKSYKVHKSTQYRVQTPPVLKFGIQQRLSLLSSLKNLTAMSLKKVLRRFLFPPSKRIRVKDSCFLLAAEPKERLHTVKKTEKNLRSAGLILNH